PLLRLIFQPLEARKENNERAAYLRRRDDRYALLEHFYRIAFVQQAFDQNRAVNAGHALVSLRYFLQYRRRFFSRFGIECDHHAARIALQNCDNYIRSDPYRSSYKVVLYDPWWSSQS